MARDSQCLALMDECFFDPPLSCENMPEIPQCQNDAAVIVCIARQVQRSLTRPLCLDVVALGNLNPGQQAKRLPKLALVPRSSEHTQRLPLEVLSSLEVACSALGDTQGEQRRRDGVRLIRRTSQLEGFLRTCDRRDVIPLQLGERGRNAQSPKPERV